MRITCPLFQSVSGDGTGRRPRFASAAVGQDHPQAHEHNQMLITGHKKSHAAHLPRHPQSSSSERCGRCDQMRSGSPLCHFRDQLLHTWSAHNVSVFPDSAVGLPSAVRWDMIYTTSRRELEGVLQWLRGSDESHWHAQTTLTSQTISNLQAFLAKQGRLAVRHNAQVLSRIRFPRRRLPSMLRCRN